jgi:hypothetical protein
MEAPENPAGLPELPYRSNIVNENISVHDCGNFEFKSFKNEKALELVPKPGCRR